MNKNIEHYLFHKENFLEESFCDNSINELNSYDWRKHYWTDETANVKFPNPEITEPDIFEQDMFSNNIHKINEFLLRELHSLILEYVESFKLKWVDGFTGIMALRFNRYLPGQVMHSHCDHIHSMFDGERKGIPILSIIGILNDDYEGGELIMFEDKKIDTKKGDLLIFPSNFLYPHEITPVTKGVRYSYVSWVW